MVLGEGLLGVGWPGEEASLKGILPASVHSEGLVWGRDGVQGLEGGEERSQRTAPPGATALSWKYLKM